MYKCIEACAKIVVAHVMFRDLPTAEYGTIAEWPVRGRLALSNHYFPFPVLSPLQIITDADGTLHILLVGAGFLQRRQLLLRWIEPF